ncbi:MAG: hypothetical protein OEZ01_01880 [Candidatus Heimdallarchaeota archaeon]|nr:hypothetical protein [Candidatus Heimdallarchaeota archaeon]MDH5644723.1 hypothetical protein [Candidatus Heimdallarchaeota archaeon]
MNNLYENSEYIQQSFKYIGLTMYETKCYLVCLSLNYATAVEIASISNVPRSKSYEALISLTSKGFLEKIQGRPMKFRAIQPSKILKIQKDTMLSNLDKAAVELEEIWNRRDHADDQQIRIIQGSQSIVDAGYALLRKAMKRVIIGLRFYFPDELDKLLKVLFYIHQNGVEIDIIIFPDIKKTIDKIYISKLKKIANIVEGPIPVRIIVVDYENMLLNAPIYRNGDIDLVFSQAIMLKNKNFVEMMDKSLKLTIEILSNKEEE